MNEDEIEFAEDDAPHWETAATGAVDHALE
jgi:hypothetical protein